MTIFVFGSNLAGKHLGGAAKYAHDRFGAQVGVGEGRTGDSYALPTLDADFQQRNLEGIRESARLLLAYAADNPDLNFYVTRVGCGIAGFTDDQIAPLFRRAPANCRFDPLWARYGLESFVEVL